MHRWMGERWWYSSDRIESENARMAALEAQ